MQGLKQMILFLEVAGLLILLVGKSVRRKNEMENVGDLKKKKEGERHVLP